MPRFFPVPNDIREPQRRPDAAVRDAPRRQGVLRSMGHLGGLAAAALACGSATAPAGSERPADEAREITVPGVELRLTVTPRVWEAGTLPRLDLTFVNGSPSPVRVGSPIEGGWRLGRPYRYALELVDERGEVVPDVFGPPPGYCARVPHFQPGVDDAVLAPGATLDAHQSPNSSRYDREVPEVARPGRYKARVRYVAEGETAMTLVSNEVDVEIRGDMALWECYRRLTARDSDTPDQGVGFRPMGVRALRSGYAVLHARDSEDESVDVLSVQLFDERGARGQALRLPGTRAWLTRAHVLATDAGLWIAHQASEEDIVTLRIEGERAQVAASLRSDIYPGYFHHSAAARSEDQVGLLYVQAVANHETDLMFARRDAATGALRGAPRALQHSESSAHDTAVAPDGKDGFLVTWTDRGSTYVLAIDAQGRSPRPAQIVGSYSDVHALRPLAGGFVVAARTYETRPDASPGIERFVLASFDGRGDPRDTRVLITSGEHGTDWGDIAWSGAAAGWAFGRRRSPHAVPGELPSELVFARGERAQARRHPPRRALPRRPRRGLRALLGRRARRPFGGVRQGRRVQSGGVRGDRPSRRGGAAADPADPGGALAGHQLPLAPVAAALQASLRRGAHACAGRPTSASARAAITSATARAAAAPGDPQPGS